MLSIKEKRACGSKTTFFIKGERKSCWNIKLCILEQEGFNLEHFVQIMICSRIIFFFRKAYTCYYRLHIKTELGLKI